MKIIPFRNHGCGSLSFRAALAVLGAVAIAFETHAADGSAGAYGFTGIGSVPYGGPPGSEAYGISADGSTIVGQSGGQAFYWKRSTGIVGLGNGAPYGDLMVAYGVSGDGSVIVGSIAQATNNQAFRWTGSTGVVPLGYLPGQWSSSAEAVSSDGNTVVGYSQGTRSGNAFIWTTSGGMANVNPALAQSAAYAVSDDGKTIVGTVSSGPFRWTSAGGVTRFGAGSDLVAGISGDGSTVVGCRVYVSYVGGSYQVTQQAYSWNASQGMVFLGYLPGTLQMSCALDASGDGSTIVGWADSGSGYKAAIWDAAHGWRDLNQVLASAGVDLVGWDLTSAMAISNDGQIITGSGTDPNGNTEGWVVTLVPEPASLGFLSSLLALAVAWKRRCERR